VGLIPLLSQRRARVPAYAEFSPAAANIVQILDMGGPEKATVAAHIDRQNPGASFLEMKNVPDGMLTF